MPLTLVVGPANAAKAGEVFARFRAVERDGPLLVVPRREDAAFYERELAGAGALLGGRVIPFGGLLREIAHRTGVAVRAVGPVHRAGIVARAVRETPFEALAASAAAPGFAPAAEALVAELRGERVGPRDLARVLAPLGAHGREVASLYGRYVAALERSGREDEEGLVWRTADALRERRTSWGRTPVLFYGFDDLSKAQRDVVETLAAHAGAPVTVSLPYEPRRAFAGRVRTYAELAPLAAEVVELPATEDFYAAPARDALHALERRLFEEDADPEPVPAAGAVRVLAAAGARAEAEVVALEVARLRERGLTGADMAIVLRSPRDGGPLLERVLAQAGIATARARERPLAHTALGRGLLGLARAALVPDASVADLLAWLRAPGVLDQPDRADQLEAECRRAAVTDAAEARRRWERDHFGLGELDRLAGAARDGLPTLLDALGRAAEWLLVRPHRAQAAVLDDEERFDALAFGAVSRALGELRELGGRAEAADVLSALAGLEVRDPEPTGSGAVLVTDPLGIRARRFRAVIVAGLEAETFPRSPRPEPFLPEEARRALAAEGIVLRREEHAADEEAYLFYAAASRATDALVLVARTADEEGNPHRPSPFVAEVERHLAGVAAPGRTLADVEWPPGRAATGIPAPADAPLTTIASREIRALARHGTVLSAGAVEAYASCPARWLVEKELAPAELDPDPDAMRRGSIVHEALERTHARLLAETGTGRVTPDNRRRAEELMATALAEARRELGADLPPVVAESIGREIAADLRRYLEQAARQSETSFEPRDFELGFGMEEEGETGPLVLGEGDEAIGVRGRIDRIDVDGAGRAIVRDYKSGAGRPDMSADRWIRGRQLQVGLYMLAVRDLLGLVPAGGLYQPFKGSSTADRRPRGVVLAVDGERTAGLYYDADVRDEAGVAEVLAAVEAEVRGVARRLRSGDVAPRPDTCGFAGRGCRHPGICRSGAR